MVVIAGRATYHVFEREQAKQAAPNWSPLLAGHDKDDKNQTLNNKAVDQ